MRARARGFFAQPMLLHLSAEADIDGGAPRSCRWLPVVLAARAQVRERHPSTAADPRAARPTAYPQGLRADRGGRAAVSRLAAAGPGRRHLRWYHAALANLGRPKGRMATTTGRGYRHRVRPATEHLDRGCLPPSGVCPPDATPATTRAARRHDARRAAGLIRRGPRDIVLALCQLVREVVSKAAARWPGPGSSGVGWRAEPPRPPRVGPPPVRYARGAPSYRWTQAR